MLEKGIVTLFGKLAGGEDVGLALQKTNLLELEFRLLMLKRDAVLLVVENFSVLESLVLAAVHIGQLMMFL